MPGGVSAPAGIFLPMILACSPKPDQDGKEAIENRQGGQGNNDGIVPKGGSMYPDFPGWHPYRPVTSPAAA